MPSSFPSSRLPSIKTKTSAVEDAGSVIGAHEREDEEDNTEEEEQEQEEQEEEQGRDEEHEQGERVTHDKGGEEKNSDFKEEHQVPRQQSENNSNNNTLLCSEAQSLDNSEQHNNIDSISTKKEPLEEKKEDDTTTGYSSADEQHAAVAVTTANATNNAIATSSSLKSSKESSTTKNRSKEEKTEPGQPKRSLFSIFTPHSKKRGDSAATTTTTPTPTNSNSHNPPSVTAEDSNVLQISPSATPNASPSAATTTKSQSRSSSRGGSKIDKRSSATIPSSSVAEESTFDKEAAERAFEAWSLGIESSGVESPTTAKKKQKFGSVRRRFTLTGGSNPMASSSSSKIVVDEKTKQTKRSSVTASTTPQTTDDLSLSSSSSTSPPPPSSTPRAAGSVIKTTTPQLLLALEKEKEELKAEIERAYSERDLWRDKYNQSLQLIFQLQETIEEYERNVGKREATNTNKNAVIAQHHTAAQLDITPITNLQENLVQRRVESEQLEDATQLSKEQEQQSNQHAEQTKQAGQGVRAEQGEHTERAEQTKQTEQAEHAVQTIQAEHAEQTEQAEASQVDTGQPKEAEEAKQASQAKAGQAEVASQIEAEQPQQSQEPSLLKSEQILSQTAQLMTEQIEKSEYEETKSEESNQIKSDDSTIAQIAHEESEGEDVDDDDYDEDGGGDDEDCNLITGEEEEEEEEEEEAFKEEGEEKEASKEEKSRLKSIITNNNQEVDAEGSFESEVTSPTTNSERQQADNELHSGEETMKSSPTSLDDNIPPMEGELKYKMAQKIMLMGACNDCRPAKRNKSGDLLPRDINYLVTLHERLLRQKEMERMQKHSTLEEKLRNGAQHLQTTHQALWLSLFEHSSRIIKDREHRSHVAFEILKTERTYVNHIRTLVEVFLLPLRQAVDNQQAIISKEDIKKIFYQLEVIYGYNKTLLSSLEDRMQHQLEGNNSSEPLLLGDLFLEMAVFLQTYSGYINNYTCALETLSSCSKNQLFIKFLQSEHVTQAVGHKKMDLFVLKDYLIMPIQRIPRYIMLLENLWKHTPRDHADYKNVSKALKKMRIVAEQNHKTQLEIENTSKIFAIQKALNHRLLDPGRRWIRDSECLMVEEKEGTVVRTVQLYLFTDILLIAKKTYVVENNSTSNSSNTNNFTVKNYKTLPLDSLSCVLAGLSKKKNKDSVCEALTKAAGSENHIFRVETIPPRTFYFSCKSTDSCQSWITAIITAKQNATQSVVSDKKGSLAKVKMSYSDTEFKQEQSTAFPSASSPTVLSSPTPKNAQ